MSRVIQPDPPHPRRLHQLVGAPPQPVRPNRPVHFTGKRDGAAMAQDGVDLLRIEGDRIAEVWLFPSDPRSEDAFWGAG